MLSDLLCAFGIACGVVQPDVSGHTILNLLDQTQGQTELLLPALGSLYQSVAITAHNNEVLEVDLGRDATVFAFVKCSGAPKHDECSFHYHDSVEKVEKFLGQSSQWMLTEVGPLAQKGEGSQMTWTAQNEIHEIVLMRIGNRVSAHAKVIFKWRP